MARIAFFPEAAFGPALNSVGIAQACRKLGHDPVFLCDRGFVAVFEGYGFPADIPLCAALVYDAAHFGHKTRISLDLASSAIF